MPYKFCDYTCYINGLEDVLAGKGGRYIDFLLSVAGGMASFAYLKFKLVKPPCMVFWNTNPKYLLRNLEQIIGFSQTLVEGKSFKTSFAKLKEFIDKSQPVMTGTLDMYYLHYLPSIYKKQHIPIHYFLVVGYDDEKHVVFVHDCGRTSVQQVPYNEFEKALDVQVPGMVGRTPSESSNFQKRYPQNLTLREKDSFSKLSRC